jgi:hypothetical protein
MIRKQKESQQIKDVLASAAIPKYDVTPANIPQGQTLRDDQGQLTIGATPEQKKLVGMTYDMKSVIPTLQALGRFDLIKDISQSQQELRKSGGILGDAGAPSPFAPYLQATNPAVRQLAGQLEAGFKKGVIDEETAYKRLEPLAKMEESYVERSAKAAEGKKPTEGERNAAGFAQRMEFSEAKLKEIENKVAEEKIAGKKVGTPYATTETQLVGSLPLIVYWARGQKMTSQQQMYRQAQENWVRANLRKESGAAIGKEEMDREIATYFPMPSDSAATIAQKNQARQVTMDAMKMASGNAYQPFDMRKFMKDNGLERR